MIGHQFRNKTIGRNVDKKCLNILMIRFLMTIGFKIAIVRQVLESVLHFKALIPLISVQFVSISKFSIIIISFVFKTNSKIIFFNKIEKNWFKKQLNLLNSLPVFDIFLFVLQF